MRDATNRRSFCILPSAWTIRCRLITTLHKAVRDRALTRIGIRAHYGPLVDLPRTINKDVVP